MIPTRFITESSHVPTLDRQNPPAIQHHSVMHHYVYKTLPLGVFQVHVYIYSISPFQIQKKPFDFRNKIQFTVHQGSHNPLLKCTISPHHINENPIPKKVVRQYIGHYPILASEDTDIHNMFYLVNFIYSHYLHSADYYTILYHLS